MILCKFRLIDKGYLDYLKLEIFIPLIVFGKEKSCIDEVVKEYKIDMPCAISYTSSDDNDWGFYFRFLGFGFFLFRQKSY